MQGAGDYARWALEALSFHCPRTFVERMSTLLGAPEARTEAEQFSGPHKLRGPPSARPR